MKNIITFFSIFIIISNSLFISISKSEESSNKNNTDILGDEVKGTLNWLMKTAIKDEEGYKWPYEENSEEYHLDFYLGTPGICLLFSKAYNITGNETYLEYAEEGINWLISNSKEENNGYKWPYAEGENKYYSSFYSGAAGIGNSFIQFYQLLGNETYLNYAKGSAKWLINIAEFEESKNSPEEKGCKWPESQNSNDYIFDLFDGAAGIGLFFLNLFNETNNETYLNYAKYAGNWLITKSYKLGDGCFTWSMYQTKLLPLDFYFSPGYAHGTAGVGDFFAELYKNTHELKYLKYAEGAGKWLIDSAVKDFKSGGVKWRWSFCRYEFSSIFKVLIFGTGWCHGPAGINKFLINLYRITNNPVYLSYAEKGAKWLIEESISDGEGFKWPKVTGRFGIFRSDSPPHICCGTAGIGEMFLDLYKSTNDSIYKTYALGAVKSIKKDAVNLDNNCCKWETSKNSYYTGHHKGYSGIALFLIESNQSL